MDFIASNTLMWFLLMVAGAGYAFYSQVKRMKNMSTLNGDELFKGMGLTVACAFVASISGFLFLCSIVINLVIRATK